MKAQTPAKTKDPPSTPSTRTTTRRARLSEAGRRGIADCCRDFGARQLVRAREGHDFFQRAAAGVHVSAGHR